MKVKELIDLLSKIDPTMDVVSSVDKYGTHKIVERIVVGCFDKQLSSFEEYVEDFDMDYDSVSISG